MQYAKPALMEVSQLLLSITQILHQSKLSHLPHFLVGNIN